MLTQLAQRLLEGKPCTVLLPFTEMYHVNMGFNFVLFQSQFQNSLTDLIHRAKADGQYHRNGKKLI